MQIIIIKNKKEKTFHPSFEGGKVFFHNIVNSHLAQEGEDWEFSVLRERPLHKVDKRGQQMWVREVKLVKRIENLFTSSLDNSYTLSSGKVVVEKGNLTDLFKISTPDWDNAYLYPNSVQMKCVYKTHEFFITLSILKENEKCLIPPPILEKMTAKQKEREQAHKEYLDKLFSDYIKFEKIVEGYKEKYPMIIFNPALNFKHETIKSSLNDRFRLEIYHNSQNVIIYAQANYDIANIFDNNGVSLKGLSYKNFSEDVNHYEGKWFKEWLEKNIVIPEPQVIDFIPSYANKNWQNIPENFWDIYNANFDKEYEWGGNDIIKVKIGNHYIEIPCERKVFKNNVEARLWYDNFDLSGIENDTTRGLIHRKLVMNQFNVKRLDEITVETFDWYRGAGAEASRIVEELKHKGFDAYYEMINVADNGLYDEEGNCYAVSPRNRSEIKVKIKIINQQT